MIKSLTYLFGIIITILIGTYLYFTLCSDCQLATVENETTQEEPIPLRAADPTSFPFAFNSGDFDYDVADNFNFNLSSDTFSIPDSLAINTGIEGLKSFLEENTNKTFNITGLYRSNEENPTAWPNLGIARANTIKNYLRRMGIPSSQTNTYGKVMDDLIPSGKTLLGPVTYAIAERAEDFEAKIEEMHQHILRDPLVVYFKTGDSNINLTMEQRQKVVEISEYLDKAEGAICKVIGHTDSTGGNHEKLGQDRAERIKAYLVRNGIPENKIMASSAGAESPIASNDTEEGRAKNRRTEVTLN